jgi:oligopeptide/dipeptide ABC transporter ATP-binding protein
MSETLLRIKGLKKHFPIKSGFFGGTVGAVAAVDDVSLSISTGRTMGLVGESGCGKTTTGRTVIRLLEPTAGEVYFKGENILELKGKDLKRIRRQMQIVFQDPYSSLNPRITVGAMITEILRFHNIVPLEEIAEKVISIMESVGLSPDYVSRYPHEFSGGQRQRIGIARALSVEPEFIVLDEPVSALDVSIQAQIINLLVDLQKKYNLTYLFIAHDLSVVEHISDDIAVMYLGRIVESGPAKDIIMNPQHPYTKALLEAVPQTDPDLRQDKTILSGDVPSPANPPSGCHFHPRCPSATASCSSWNYKLINQSKNRQVACLLYE